MYALVDCNNFYASCERLFNPRLAGRPVVVLSNNDGCVVARSAEAKAMGIEMAGAWHQVAERYPQVVALSSNYALYGEMSRRVTTTLRGFSYQLENYSIDESFLEFLPGVDWGALGREMKRTVKRHTGLPVSVGFGETKVLAKVANRLAKKRPELGGCHVITPENVDEALASLATSDIWGIARRTAEKLAGVGVRSALDLKLMDVGQARRLMTVVGERIVMELRGVSCLEIEEVAAEKQEICTAKSFGRPVESLDELREVVACYVSRVAEKLRAQGSVCGRVHVGLETNPFKPEERQYFNGGGVTLATPSNFTPTLAGEALRVLDGIYRPGYRYKRAVVMLLELGPEHAVQACLFDSTPPEDVEKRRRLMAAVDTANKVWGRGTVRLGSAAGLSPEWRMRQKAMSPAYLSSWEEIPVARVL